MERFRFSDVEQSLIEESSIPMAYYQFLDRRVVTVALSRGMCRIFGFKTMDEAYDVMNHDMYRDVHPDDIARISDAAYRFATEDDKYDVVYRSSVDGQYRIFRARGEHEYKRGTRLGVVRYMDEGPYSDNDTVFTKDINESLSELVREQTIRHEMKYDYLTGLPSMTYFFELAANGKDRMLEKGERPVMLYVDLTGMKLFNQKYGFKDGDKLIKGVADVLKKHFSTENCGRFGGDHFAIYTSLDDLEERLNDTLSDMKDVNEGVNLPVRIGIYVTDENVVEPSIACDRAKMACDAIRSKYVSGFGYFTPDMLEKEEKRQYFIANIDRAIAGGWIKVYYQPIVRAANGRVSDEEALARWTDPEKGVILPQEFISVLEDAKLIYKLDLHVISRVIDKLKQQKEAGLYMVPQSVNLSRADFYSCDIVEEVRKLVDDAGLDRKLITVELTESIVASDVEYIKREVERFQELGFSVWMDDFGSGYSSPEVLQKIHFDTIKFEMQYMHLFYAGNESRIILSELVRMAISLGIETVVEGVETDEQVEFLKEIGCTKLQGYHYCKPLSLKGIFERYRTGTQIGFENPDEAPYYAVIGRVNLYDLGTSFGDGDANDEDVAKKYFNTMPINIVEWDGERITMLRSNQSFRKLFKDAFAAIVPEEKIDPRALGSNHQNELFLGALSDCYEDGKQVFLDEVMNDGNTVHLFIRRIATNPVRKVAAYVVAVLGFTKESDEFNVTFASVIQELSSDYLYFYYIDLDTEEYVEYGLGNVVNDIFTNQKGRDFFAESRKNARIILYPQDIDMFLAVFTKENVKKAIEDNGSFNFTYRLMLNGVPTYVNMKVVRAGKKGNGIIMGVSNIDAQKKQQAEIERAQQERRSYARVSALSSDLMVIYTVDPVTEKYEKFASSEEYVAALIEERGTGFFEKMRDAGRNHIFADDQEMFLNSFTKDNVLDIINRSGIYSVNVRGLLEGDIVYVTIKAALISEGGVDELVVGIVDVDEQVKRELEYASKLTAARNEANKDALTGVKSKHAYIDVEEEINRHIEEKTIKEFAVAVFDINGLKYINDTFGHKKGDEYIKKGCSEICEIFAHCPVFRVGGDEFAVIAQGKSYEDIELLMKQVENKNTENMKNGGVIVAAGFARFDGDKNVAGVFERADKNMYENKKYLKSIS
ncbi:sensor domain-containing diguanylate cyclase [Oribacterium sp. P6A1]|uniref:sensor domain-containing diguanylate cyclase n=1 Tax=Oribacterium sp. P6A1 TaxID=1410612 RepID=UPI0009DD973D|nr:EAL domain-containing protein [Oribacterium sp. P6A1]